MSSALSCVDNLLAGCPGGGGMAHSLDWACGLGGKPLAFLGRLEGRRPLSVLHPPGAPLDEGQSRGCVPDPRFCQTLLGLFSQSAVLHK